MKEEKTLQVGGIDLKLKISNFEEFRKTNLVNNNKYLVYFDGRNFWRIEKEIGLPAIGKQIKKFLEEDRTFKEANFEKGIGFIPVLFFNALVESQEIPERIKIWFKALESFLKEGKIIELPSYFLEHSFISQGSQKIAVLRGSGLNFLYDWLNRVFSGRVKLKVCEAEFCDRLYIPAKPFSRFCCEAHRAKTFYEKSKLINIKI